MTLWKFWTGTALKFILRSGRSTLILSLMVLISVAALIFLSSLAVGVNDAMVRNSVSLYSGHVSGFNLPSTLKRTDLELADTETVLKRVLSPGVLMHKNRIRMVNLVMIDPAAEMAGTALWKKTLAGRYPVKDEQTVFISRTMADWLELQVGDEVFFSPDLFSDNRTSLTVTGIYETGVYQLDQEMVFSPFGAVPIIEADWSAAVFLKQGADPARAIDFFHETWPETRTAGSFKSWTELMPDLKQLIDLNYVSMSMVILLVFGVVSLGLSCAFVIFILKNIREYGIMKAMGVSPRETAFLIATEVTCLNLAASLLGIICGALVALIVQKTGGIDLTAFTSHNRYFVVSGVILPRLTLFALLAPPATAFVFALAAAVWPAALVIRTKAAEILRIV